MMVVHKHFNIIWDVLLMSNSDLTEKSNISQILINLLVYSRSNFH